MNPRVCQQLRMALIVLKDQSKVYASLQIQFWLNLCNVSAENHSNYERNICY